MTGGLDKYEKPIYLLTWVSAVLGLLIMAYRRFVGRPTYSYIWWALTGWYSDWFGIIFKILAIVDLLLNKVPITLESIRSTILVLIIYVQLIDISVYF